MPYIDEQLLDSRIAKTENWIAYYEDCIANPTTSQNQAGLFRMHERALQKKEHLLTLKSAPENPDISASRVYMKNIVEAYDRSIDFHKERNTDFSRQRTAEYQQTRSLFARALECDMTALLELLSITQNLVNEIYQRVQKIIPDSEHLMDYKERLAHLQQLLKQAQSIHHATGLVTDIEITTEDNSDFTSCSLPKTQNA